MKLNLRRASSADRQRAVIATQRGLLADKDEQILALEVELEATRALVDVDRDDLVATYRQLARVQRARADFLRSQVDLALELLDARRLQEGTA